MASDPERRRGRLADDLALGAMTISAAAEEAAAAAAAAAAAGAAAAEDGRGEDLLR